MKQPQKAKSSPKVHRPLLARAVNALGITTSSLTDNILSWVQALLFAGIAATLIIVFVVMRVNVPTPSMEPTIPVGSSFFVDKISYYFRKPTPGQFIVFWHTNARTRETDRLVKRLIAVGGQTVQIKDCTVFVDGKPLTDPEFNSPSNPDKSRQCYYNDSRSLMSDPSKVLTVPERDYFVLGDNSANSEDGRFWGFVKEREFIGVPFLQVWPTDRLGFVNGYFSSSR